MKATLPYKFAVRPTGNPAVRHLSRRHKAFGYIYDFRLLATSCQLLSSGYWLPDASYFLLAANTPFGWMKTASVTLSFSMVNRTL